DGATSEGDFHEAMNFAGVWHVPVVFVCQNNQWAISVPLKKQTHSRTIAQKALAYGIPGIQVDGNDVLAVYAAAREAVDRARVGGGPTLIECVTYRPGGPTTPDDPSKYRAEEEVTMWEKKDPLTRFRAYLEKRSLLEQDIEARVDEEIAQAVQRFEMTPPPDPLTMFDHVYAELPPDLAAQRAEVAEREAAGPPRVGEPTPLPPRATPMRGQRMTRPGRPAQAEHGQGPQPGTLQGDGARRRCARAGRGRRRRRRRLPGDRRLAAEVRLSARDRQPAGRGGHHRHRGRHGPLRTQAS